MCTASAMRKDAGWERDHGNCWDRDWDTGENYDSGPVGASGENYAKDEPMKHYDYGGSSSEGGWKSDYHRHHSEKRRVDSDYDSNIGNKRWRNSYGSSESESDWGETWVSPGK